MKEFMLNGQKYLFEYNANEERKVKLFLKNEQGMQNLHGDQKGVIVEKLYEIIQENPYIAIPENKKQYVENYVNGTDRSAHETTNTLGKILNDCLENGLGGSIMDLNDVVFKPWRNGTESDSTGYGLCVSKEHAKLFPKTWRQVIVEVVYKEESETLCFNLNDTFWTTCPDIKNVRMREWFKKAGITWNGKKPEFETVYLGDNRFRIILG